MNGVQTLIFVSGYGLLLCRRWKLLTSTNIKISLWLNFIVVIEWALFVLSYVYDKNYGKIINNDQGT
jgi:hypothetical protein